MIALMENTASVSVAGELEGTGNSWYPYQCKTSVHQTSWYGCDQETKLVEGGQASGL